MSDIRIRITAASKGLMGKITRIKIAGVATTIRNLIIRIHPANNSSLYAICFGVVYLLWNYTAFIQPGGVPGLFNAGLSTLDASWIIGLNWASNLHLSWAENNLVLTYGPLYYLDGKLLPEFHRHRTLLIVQAGMNLLFAACFSYVFSFFSELGFGTKNKWLLVVVAALLLVQQPNISLLPLFVAFISLPIIFPKAATITKPAALIRYVRYGIIAGILALIPFMKFSHIYESILFVVVLVFFLIYGRKFIDGALLCCFFIIFSILIWVLASGEKASSYWPYLQTRFMVSGGYTEAMMLDFSQSLYFQIFVLALSYFVILSPVLIYLLSIRQINWTTAWLLPLITLFLGFKSAFVRADHAPQFLGYVTLSALYYFYLTELMDTNEIDTRSTNWRKPLAQLFVPFLVIIVIGAFSITGIKLLNNEFLSARALFSSDAYSQTRARAFLKKLYSIDAEFLSRIDRNKSIDVIPWDIALLYGYDLAWKPRPVLQSYVSYTSTLDDLDAAFFQTPGSPDQLIYSSSAIDNRYFVFDTPHTFRVLLGQYRFVTSTEDNRFALLKKRSRSLPLNMVFISQSEHLLNETIQIPNVDDGHVFTFIEIEPTIVGKLLDFLYKSKPLYVEMALADGTAKTHRFIRDVGKNGLFVSVYLQNLDDLSSVFNATYEPNIKTIRFIGSDWLYTNRFRVRFYKIPFDE